MEGLFEGVVFAAMIMVAIIVFVLARDEWQDWKAKKQKALKKARKKEKKRLKALAAG
jgi:NADH:ubiquinone oxidoreductase subunit F (NADH-binding)